MSTSALPADALGMTADGPPQRLAALFQEAGQLVHRTARRITGSPQDAEDVVQSVFLHLLTTCPPAPWPDNPRAYVHRATVNAALDLLRRRKRRPEAPLEVEPPGEASRSEEDALLSAIGSRRDAEQLREAMKDLSALEAEMFSLRYLEELDNGEIAKLLDKTANHVRVTLHSARRKLRTFFEARDEAQPSGEAS